MNMSSQPTSSTSPRELTLRQKIAEMVSVKDTDFKDGQVLRFEETISPLDRFTGIAPPQGFTSMSSSNSSIETNPSQSN
jgi:hypothetical protein